MTQDRSPRSFLTTRPVAITMVFLAAAVFGLLSYFRLPVTLMPDLSYPTLTVRTEYPGAAPEEVENDVSRPIEEAVGVAGSLKRVSSISRAGVSDVVLEFAWDTTMSDATQNVLEKLDQVFLPSDAKRPLILHFDPSEDPILELSLRGIDSRHEGERGLRRLRRIADLQVKRSLESIKGVAAVRIRGGLEEEIHVLLDESELVRTGISVQRVIDRLAAENINLAGGTIKDGRSEYMVRTLGEYVSLDQVRETIIGTFGDRRVRIADLGQVIEAHKEREIITRTDGRESVQIDIFKEADANIVAVAHRIKQAVGELEDEGEESAGAPRAASARSGAAAPSKLAAALVESEGAKLEIVSDRSLFIESSIRELRMTALIGGVLAILVLLLFLRKLRPTAIIALSIPVSLAVTFAPLNLLGITLNIMSLGGLALGIGMLVDSSIVVLESIHRCGEEGDEIAIAVERGTREVRSAVMASTLTSIAVFLPMVFIEGVAGQAFGNLGLAVVVSLLASLTVALFLIPMLASLHAPAHAGSGLEWSSLRRFRASSLLRDSARKAQARLAQAGAIGKIGLTPFYLLLALPYWLLRLVVGSVLEVLGKLFLLLLFAFARSVFWVFTLVTTLASRAMGLFSSRTKRKRKPLYPRILRAALAHPFLVSMIVVACFALSWQILVSLDSELLPEVHQGEFTVEVALPVGTPLEHTQDQLTPVENAILSEKEQIRSLLLTLGYDSASSLRSDEGEHSARFTVLLERRGDVEALEREVIARLRERFAGIPDLEARIVRPVIFSSKTPIEVEIQGDELGQLKGLADRARQLMASIPQLADVESSLRSGAPEVQVIYDREALSRLNLNIAVVARLVRDKVKGFEATRYNLQDRRVPIIVRLALTDRESVDEIRSLIINPGGETPIPLGAVAELRLGEGPSEVRRIDGQRSAVIGANIASGSLSHATELIQAKLDSQMEFPLGTSYKISGQHEEWQASQRSLWLVLALSVFLVYVIMAAQFESLVHPLVIMFTIPLAFIGTVIALKALGLNLSVVVFLGMIMLAGIVVNNAIVLVDYINTLRRRGIPRDEAIVTAGQVRLRPIVMTTATTVLGLLPMALGLGDGAEIRTPMAVAVISGLLSSTLLTLIVIPTVYASLDTVVMRLRPNSAALRRNDASGGFDSTPAPAGP